MRKTKFLAVAMTSLIPFSPNAAAQIIGTSNFDYNYYSIRIGFDPLTYGAGFSSSVHPNARIHGNLNSEFKSDFDGYLAFGFHAPMSDWADFYGNIGARAAKRTGLFNGDTKVGVEVNIGVRQWIGPQMEVNAEIGHLSISNENKINGAVGIRFRTTELFSFGLEGRFNTLYGNQTLITARFNFL